MTTAIQQNSWKKLRAEVVGTFALFFIGTIEPPLREPGLLKDQ